MPPFSMLRTKKGRKSRPRTPPSPGSFYSPARSPAPWTAVSAADSTRSGSQDPQGRRAQGSAGRRAPPSAWAHTEPTEKVLPRPPPRSTSKDDHAPGLQLDLGGPSRALGDNRTSWWLRSEPDLPAMHIHSRRPSVVSTAVSSPRARTPALEQSVPKPSPLANPSPLQAEPALLTEQLGPSKATEMSVSGSKSTPPSVEQSVSGPKASAPVPLASVAGSSNPEPTGSSNHRRVPTPIRIPRTHVHAPSVTIERTPSPSTLAAPHPRSNSPPSQPPPTSTPTSEQPSPDPSTISESAPELMTVLRAERASAAMLGIGFTLRATREDEDRLSVAGGALRMDSATLPPENVEDSPTDGIASTAARRATLRRSISTDGGLIQGTASSSRPSTVYSRREVALFPTSRPETVYTSSPVDAPALLGRPETIYAVPSGGMHRISEVPSTPGSSQLLVNSFLASSSSPSSPLRSPTRLRSKTVATPNESRRDMVGREMYANVGRLGELSLGSRQRSATLDVSPHLASAGPGSGHAAAGSISGYAQSTIRRSRSPSGTTATTHPSRPVTPLDPYPPAVLTHPRGKSVNAPGSAMQTGAGNISASQSGSAQAPTQATSTPNPPSPAARLAYLDSPPPNASPLVRTTRLQSAPMAFGSGSSGSTTLAGSPLVPVPFNGSPSGPASILSKFARSQMGFENFSFLATRGRSISESTRGSPADDDVSPTAGSSTQATVPVRPARPPSLTLDDEPRPPPASEQPRLAHSHSGSSTGSGFRLTRSGSNGAAVRGVGSARLRRKKSSRGANVVAPERLERSASGSIGRGGTTGHQRNASITSPELPSISILVPGLQRTGSNTDSSSGSQRTAGTQQHTPTSTGSSPPPAMTLKQRRETVFPTTPRSFSHESTLLDSPPMRGVGGPVPDLPGFVLNGDLLMPIKSPLPVPSGTTASSNTRKAHLPIGPKTGPVPARLEMVPPTAAPTPSVMPTPAPSSGSKTATARSQPKQQQPPSPRAQSKQPPSPTFEPIPVRWRGLTMDAAKWTFSSNQLQSIVSRAIKQSAETSSVRLLPLDVLDQELPIEVDRLEQLRDVLQTRYKAQVRRRRLLMRSLALYIDGHDPPTSRRLLDELEDVGIVCDQLAEDLYLVGDQLAQISRLRDVHSTSALAVALRKINQSYIRARSEVVELQTQRAALEAERDEAWLMAESLEREIEAKQPADSSGDTEATGSEGKSRVSAARKSSVRQSKVGLRKSIRRSVRSSTSGGSMRYHSILFPRPPTSAPSFVDSGADTSGEFIPPVPPVPTPSNHLSTIEPSRPESIGVLPSGVYALSPGAGSSGPGEPYSVMGVPTPSATSHDLFIAQNELLKMLGLSYKEYGFRIRPRSYSDSSPATSPPGSPNTHPNAPPSAFVTRGKLFRSSSDQALRRHSSLDRVIAVQVPATGGVPEDPAAILAALTLPQDDL